MPGVKHRLLLFPIFVDEGIYGSTRDELYFKLQEKNIFGRRYFYPLISEFATLSRVTIGSKRKSTQRPQIADSVICLPIIMS